MNPDWYSRLRLGNFSKDHLLGLVCELYLCALAVFEISAPSPEAFLISFTQ